MPLNEQRRPSTHVEASRLFRANFDAPRAARRFVGETLDQTGVAVGIDDAKLVVTELATNSVVHARSDFRLSVWVAGEDLYIAVSDYSSDMPALAARTEDGGGGGLAIVALLATEWGAERTAAGKRVWAGLKVRGSLDGTKR
jgi:anti-sigma regulatory factor (Ser/Thr protein kinase)